MTVGTKNKKARIILWVTLGPAVFFLTGFILLQMFAPALTLRYLGINFFIIEDTRSMEPKIKANDLVVVQKYDFDKVKEGDFIAFTTGGTLDGKPTTFTIVHSVIEVVDLNGTRALRTKGVSDKVGVDARLVTEKGAGNTNEYVGKYAFRNAFLGHAMAFLKSGAGLVAIAINAAFIAAFICFEKYFEEEEPVAPSVLDAKPLTEEDADKQMKEAFKGKSFFKNDFKLRADEIKEDKDEKDS